MKKFISLVLASVMLLSLLASGVTVSASDAPSVGTVDESYSAEGTPITDAAGFAAMEADGKYYLANDITIDATWNAGNEVSSTYANNAAFTGSLDGNGKTITTSAPLFANLCGTVKNLTVEGTLAESELHAANITMWTNGTVTVDNVYTKADIPLGNTSGGIIGYAATGATITITNCRNDADILCTGQVGGMVGYVQDYTLIIENCINNGNLYSTNYGAGIVGRFGRDNATYPDSYCIIKGCTNNGKITSEISQTAGILGFLCGNAVISDCINNGTIINYSGAAAGIFGSHANKGSQCGLTIENCENYGTIEGLTYVAGIAARVGRNISHAGVSYRTENCVNYGLVKAQIYENFSSTVYVGGIVAYAYGKKASLSNGVVNCVNIGTVEVTSDSDKCDIYVGGILGYVNALTYEVKNNINAGAINISGFTTVAALTAYNKNAEASDVYNNYSVASGNIAAGYFGDPLSLTLNPDVYVITSEQLASGEVAYLINEAAGETIYYQKIGEDSTPVLTPAEDGSNTVYKQNDGSFGNTLPASLNGDVNGDGRVDIRDAAAIMLFISGKPVECMSEVIDTNGDGEIDLKDAENILKNITGHVDAELKKSNLCEHKLTLVPAIEATCTTKGNIEYYSCSECSMLFKDNKASVLITYAAVEVPVSHIPGEWVITVPPTDTEDGVNTQYCSICGVTIATDIILKNSSLGLEYTLKDDQKSYSVSGIGTCTDTDIVISPTHNGLPVTSIGYNAFNGCSAITSVVIPEGVTSIANYAFNGCSGLTSIVMPESLTNIGSYGLGRCSSLTSVVIPDGVTNIGSYAFSDCDNLQSVNIPKNLKTISNGMFYYCTALTSVTIPDSVTSIGDYVFFHCYDLASVTIPDSVKSIGNFAFYCCTSLTSLDIPNGITTIPQDMVSSCSNLTSINIPDSVTSIESYAFYYCEKLTSVTIPDGVTSIGDNAFGDCINLASITIPDSVTSIGIRAFGNCTNLTSVTLSGNITSIADNTFYLCSNLTSIIIPEGVTSIGEYAFDCCTGLTSIDIPDSVTSIGRYAFGNCTGLTSITIPNSVTIIADNAFRMCSGLTSITIPYGVTSIGDYAFESCSGLTTIEIPETVTSIGKYAFGYCTSLTSLTLPSGITTINPGLFADCHNLTSVTIPDSVTSIGRFAFMYCESLTSITLPNGITTISHGMLAGCKNLTSIIIPNGVTSIANEAFSGCSGLISITIPNSVTIIDANAFWFCSGLTSITIPYGVTIIGDRAFDSCSGLTSITVPSSVQSIGADVFQRCSSLEHFIFKGTEEAFNAIDKDINWNVDANFTVTFDPPFEIYEGPADDFKFTAQSVIGNVSYDTYTDFNAIAEKSFLVPALAEKMVPQGMDVWEERGWLLISGYFADSADFDSSVLLAIDMNTGAYVGEYYLTNADGTPHTSHAGGVAVTEKNVYISNGSKLYCIPLTEIIDAGQCGKITISEEISVPVAASFCNYSGGYLWVGDFQYGSSYTTEEFRHMINREGNEYLAWIVGYKLTDATESGIKAESMVNGSYATPDVVLSITNRIQGMTVSGNSIILSQSYGRANDSTLYVFENPIGATAHTETVLNGVTVPVYFLDGKLSCDKVTALPMSEGIAYSDGKLYVLFESGADKYANDGGKNPTENVWTIKMD